jgi:hypothetical protein
MKPAIALYKTMGGGWQKPVTAAQPQTTPTPAKEI